MYVRRVQARLRSVTDFDPPEADAVGSPDPAPDKITAAVVVPAVRIGITVAITIGVAAAVIGIWSHQAQT
jgi:hypothetical protein